MKRILLSSIILLTLSSGLQAQTAPDAPELTKLLQDFLDGAGHNDAAMHERFWADDLIYTASAGRRIGKADIMKEVQEEGPPKPGDETTVFSAEDIRIQQYGDTAIVTGRSAQKGMENGKDYSGDYRFTRVYVKEKGRWVTVALQTTLIRQ